jgi:hypothetical protein
VVAQHSTAQHSPRHGLCPSGHAPARARAWACACACACAPYAPTATAQHRPAEAQLRQGARDSNPQPPNPPTAEAGRERFEFPGVPSVGRMLHASTALQVTRRGPRRRAPHRRAAASCSDWIWAPTLTLTLTETLTPTRVVAQHSTAHATTSDPHLSPCPCPHLRLHLCLRTLPPSPPQHRTAQHSEAGSAVIFQ